METQTRPRGNSESASEASLSTRDLASCASQSHMPGSPLPLRQDTLADAVRLQLRSRTPAAVNLTERHEDRDIEAEAYAEAIEQLERDFKDDAKSLTWLRNVARSPSSSSISSRALGDLLATTRQAEEKYSGDVETHRGKKTAMRWLRGLLSRVMYYGRVFDMLSNHHPEYVALVWGLIKFVLMGIINHGTLVSEFSKALAHVAHVLPLTQINAQLYRMPLMRHAVGRLYAQVLLFLRQAVRWYGGGRFGRALKSVFRPFELELGGVISEIKQCSRMIDEVAKLGMRVDVRGISVAQEAESAWLEGKFSRQEELLRLSEARLGKIDETLEAVMNAAGVSGPVSIEPWRLGAQCDRSRSDIMRCNLQEIMSVNELAVPPDEALIKHQSLLRRATPWRKTSGISDRRLLNSLHRWSGGSNPSVLVLKAQPRAQVRIREIVTEAVSVLRCSGRPIIWYLSDLRIQTGEPQEDGGSKVTSLTDVLRTLVYQALQLAPKDRLAAEPDNFNAQKVTGEHTVEEWMTLLARVLGILETSFVVIEAEDLMKWRQTGEYEKLVGMFQGLFHKPEESAPKVKLLFVSYRDAWTESMSPMNGQGEASVQISMMNVKRDEPVPPHQRRAGARAAFQKDLRRSFTGNRGLRSR